MNTVIPSVIAKSQWELNGYYQRLQGVSSWLHLDIVDGKFARNRSLDFPFRLSPIFMYSAHLMVKNPEKLILKLLPAIELLIPQFEELKHPAHFISYMRTKHKKVALALKPETAVTRAKPYLKNVDYILVLTVHPGFYGRRYLPAQLQKIKQIKKINPRIEVIVDGGMNPTTIRQAACAGADYFITGSYTTKADNPRKALHMLKMAIRLSQVDAKL